MAKNDDVEVRISGSVDPSLRLSTEAAKAQIAELGSAADALSISQRSMAAAVLAGAVSLDSLGKTMHTTSDDYQKIAAVIALVRGEHQAGSVATAEAAEADKAALASMLAEEKASLISYATEKAQEVAITKEAAAAEAAAYASALAEEKAALLSYRVAKAEEAALDKAALLEMNTQVAEEVAAEKAALASVLAEEKAALVSYKTMKAEEVAIAKEAATAKARATQVVTSVPLYAAQDRLATATAAANAQLAAGTITTEQNAAAVAAATTAYNKKIAALLKSGEATMTDTGELIANTVATEVNTTAKSALIAKLTSGRSAMEFEAAGRAILTGNMGRLASATAVEVTRLNLLQYAFSGVGLAVTGVIAALVAFGIAADQAVKAANWAEELKRASESLGLTTTQLQEFDHVFVSIGVDTEKGRKALSGLEQTFGTVEAGGSRAKNIIKIFKEELHITPEQLRGWGDLGTQIPHVVDALSRMNAEERAAAEKSLKIDPEVIQSLIDHKNAIAGIIAQAHEYGIIIPADVIDTSAAAADEMKNWKSVIDGELRAAFITLAPLVAGGAKGMADLAHEFANGARGAIYIVNTINNLVTSITNFVTWVDKAVPLLGAMDKLFFGAPAGIGKAAGALDGFKIAIEAMLNPLGSLVHLLQLLGILSNQTNYASQAAAATRDLLTPKPKADQLLSDTSHHAKGPSVVSEWAEQLHAQEVASKDYFGDQTQHELDFWNSKLGLVRKGSRDWLEIQSKIYEAQKRLEHDKYEEHLADLGVRMEADRDNWTAEKADWDERLAYIASKFHEESAEYKRAYREFEAAEREHARVMRQIAHAERESALTELKTNLNTDKSIREENTRQAESEIQYRAQYSLNPLAQVQAEQQIAALHRQAAQQNLAAMEREHVAVDRNLQADIDAEKQGTTAHANAVRAKHDADVEYANQHRQLLNQMANQEKAAALKIKETWHSIVDPMVKATGDNIMGLIKGTETWGQALANIGEAALSLIVTKIEEVVAEWIVARIAGVAGTSAQIQGQAALAGAGGVASMAAAPFPIDLGAPAFGASMFAAASAFQLGSFDKGTNYVPNDMVAQIHEGERIVPKADNTALLGALAGGGTNNGGDFHGDFGVHIHGVGSGDMDGRKVVRALEGAQSHFSKLLKGMHRNGKFAYAG